MAFSKKYRLLVLFAALATLLSAVLDALLIGFIKDIINRGFVEKNQKFLVFFPIYIFIFFFIRALTGYASEYLVKRSEYSVLQQLREQFSHFLMQLPKTFFDHRSLGDIQSSFSSRLQLVAEGATRIPLCYMREVLLAVLLVVIMFIESWQLSSIALVSMPIVYGLYRYTANLHRIVSAHVQKDEGAMMQLSGQVFANTEMIQSYGVVDFFQKKFSQLILSHQRSSLDSAHYAALLSSSLYIVTSIPLAFMMWWLYRFGVMPSVGSVAAILIALMRIIHPLRLISELTHLFQKSLVAHDFVQSMMQVSLPVIKHGSTDQPGLYAEHVCYQIGSEMIIKDICLHLLPNEKVAIIGSSGAGKSTLLQLLSCVYQPTFGQIKCGSKVAYVRQDSWLFSASVRENLLFDHHVNEQQLMSLLRDLDMFDWINGLPAGIDTVIGQGQLMMSGGQMQRLCLARALMRKAEYLLLDEITSALDRVTEKLVMDVILKSQCAAVLVTHRLNYLKDYDRVILMDSGQIIALGHFNELMANSAAFRNFYNRLSSQTNML